MSPDDIREMRLALERLSRLVTSSFEGTYHPRRRVYRMRRSSIAYELGTISEALYQRECEGLRR